MPTFLPPARRLARLPLVVLPAALVAGVPATTVAPAAPAASADRALDIVATDFALAAPDTVVAGRTRVRLTNRGGEPHIVEIARLDGARTAEDLVATLTARQVPSWATWAGGPLIPPPNGASEATVDLAPGRYVLYCPVPSPATKKYHMAMGMTRTLVVVPAPERPARAERADVSRAREARIVLDDYGFVLEPAWEAGRYAFSVENRAAQPHEVAVMRLAPGKHVADVLEWARTLAGPPPGEFIGGTTALSRGNVVEFEAALEPGDYALLCFLVDATDGRSHVAHGMTREVQVTR